MGAGRYGSGFRVGYWLIIVTLAPLCCGCFSANRFLLPTGENVLPILGDYQLTIWLANANSMTYNSTTNDTQYHLYFEVENRETVRAGIASDSGPVVRFKNVCINASCLGSVYCPVLSGENRRSTSIGDGDSTKIVHYSSYDFGWIKIPEECDSVILSFEARLVDTVADSLLEAESFEWRLGFEKSKIPAILPI